MLYSFSCKNFYSFKEENTVSFIVNKQAPKNHGYFMTPSGTRLSKVGVVIGPNASGKTNLLKVVPFLRWMIVTSFSKSPDTNIPIKSFQFGKDSLQPSTIDVTFELSNHIYRYIIIVTADRIFEEKLFIQSKTKKRVTEKKLFARNWDEAGKQYKLDFGKGFNPPAGIANTIRQNASLLSTAFHLNHKLSQEIINLWKKIETNVIELGHKDESMPNALIRYSDNSLLKKKMEAILSKYDLGFSSLNISKEKTETGYHIEADILHSIGSKIEKLSIKYESSGTKRLLILLQNILASLESGSPAIIDEIDINLHPDMIIELIGLYLHPETNPNNAQILTSTHSHIVLSKLDKYQIFLTEKNELGSTESWRLDEVEGVRSDDNYYTKYMAGSYGAIPNFDI